MRGLRLHRARGTLAVFHNDDELVVDLEELIISYNEGDLSCTDLLVNLLQDFDLIPNRLT